jgi:A/G-specific adenine glycosylase
VPDDYETLRTLPGIGQYMAGAILSIAFNKPYPIVDGNVRRVLSRVHGWTGENAKQLWEAADRLVHQAEPRAVNQALMELGATVCSFRSPHCLVCPIREVCVAWKTGTQDRIPVVRRRPETIRVVLFAVVQEDDGRHLMRNVKGLWEFPMFAELPSGAFVKAGTCRHTITHHRLEVNVYSGTMEGVDGFEWAAFDSVPVSSLTRKIFTSIPFPTGEDGAKRQVRGPKKK